MRILVDHLTRMAPGYICVAGLDDDGHHIRPVLERTRLGSALLATNGGPFEVGAAIDLGSVEPIGRTPEVEDHLFEPANASYVGARDEVQLWSRVETDAELSLVDVFGHDLVKRGKTAFVPEGQGRVSLGTLAPGWRPRLRLKDGLPRLILHDPMLEELELAVTDVRLFAESHREWGCRQDLVKEIDEQLHAGRPCLLSVGLTRPFAGSEGEPVHWLQVNNIHLLPDSLADSETKTSEVSEDTGRRTASPAGPDKTDGVIATRDRRSGTDTQVAVDQVAVAGPTEGNQEIGPIAPRNNMWPARLPVDTPRSEQTVWNALGSLPEDWRVFHGVRWQSLRRGSQGDGEADFVMIHPDRGLLVLEVKGGGLRIEGGVWYTEGRHGSHRIDPLEQARSSKHALLTYLRETVDDFDWMETGHAVWFPDVRVEGNLGPAAPSEIILDSSDLGNVQNAIERVSAHWELDGSIGPSQLRAIEERLAPSRQLRITVADRIREVSKQVVLLTEAQARALDGLRNARRVLVVGGAGTGKTVLAIEKARRLSAAGYRVALTCYNRPLGDFLEREFTGNPLVDSGSFHRLARKWIQGANLPWPAQPDDTWWGHPAAELVLEAASRLEHTYDAVIIDEGQDFTPTWFMALEGLMGDPLTGQIVVFADNHQMIYRDSWEPPYETIRYDLDRNVRNTLPISTVVARVIGDSPPTEGTDGPPVEFFPIDESDRLTKIVGRIVHGLVREEHVDPNQVVVLTQEKDDRDTLRSASLAGLPAIALENSGNGVVVETIHRFKGLESDVVLVVLRDIDTRYEKALAYIGISRAKAKLMVISSKRIAGAIGLST